MVTLMEDLKYMKAKKYSYSENVNIFWLIIFVLSLKI